MKEIKEWRSYGENKKTKDGERRYRPDKHLDNGRDRAEQKTFARSSGGNKLGNQWSRL